MYCQCNKYLKGCGICDDPYLKQSGCPGKFNFPRPCCCNYKKTKVKGKFGLAYIVQTEKTKYCKPFGWQVDFHDTPSRVDHNCKKMIKWVTSPPLGGCSNAETNFWCYPEECGEVLKNEVGRNCRCDKKPNDQPNLKCSYSNDEFNRSPKQSQRRCSKCYNTHKKSCYYEQKCSEALHENNCFSNDYCYYNDTKDDFMKPEKQNRCKNCKYPDKCDCNISKAEPADKKLQCKYCKCGSCHTSMCKCCPNCYVEEQICAYCGKVVEQNYFVKKEKNDDSLDYVPKRDSKTNELEITTNADETNKDKKANEKKEETGKLPGRSKKKECGCDLEDEDKDQPGKGEKVTKLTYYDGESLLQRIKRARNKQKEIVQGSPRASV